MAARLSHSEGDGGGRPDSSGASSGLSTLRCASSGRNSSTGSSSRSLHSSTRIIAAAAVIGFVIEAMRPKSGDLGAVRYSSQDGNHRHRARERRIIGLKFDKFNDALCWGPASQIARETRWRALIFCRAPNDQSQ